MRLKINSDIKYQTMEGFGASGAWWAQMVGSWTHKYEDGTEIRDKISSLLFSKAEGIGLNIYRYNIGAGSAHSGRGSYSMPARKTECFETSPGEYDWSRDAAAVYMMKQAVKDGAEDVILFVNSPIERLTKNHKAHLDKHQIFRENISKKNYGEFAKYCLDVTEHFLSEGIPVKYLSPINEPIWIWNGGQEGCHYKPHSCRAVFETFADEMSKRKALDGVKLSGCESGDIRWFNKSYTRSILNSKKIRKSLDAIDIHSYCLPAPLPLKFLNERVAFTKRFARWMQKKYPDVPINMSEWCHMQGGRDKSINSALVMANVMYEDISILNVISWQHWIAVSEVDYCDGLIYINLDDKTFEMTKRYYATGNFSKYIKKGAVRIDATCEDPELKILAFEQGEETVAVIINDSKKEKLLDVPDDKKLIKTAVTDSENNLEEYIQDTNTIKITPKSITTAILR